MSSDERQVRQTLVKGRGERPSADGPPPRVKSAKWRIRPYSPGRAERPSITCPAFEQTAPRDYRGPLFHIAAINKLRVYVSVPQIHSRSALPGVKATLTLAEFPGRLFRGKLGGSQLGRPNASKGEARATTPAICYR
jgi:multidrug efflux pump subunit AcrA (membrane-fusion protein)